ncbi:MAG: HAD-IB family phosphatase [bacterium]|nr:HAD-IB family phosphatase [bacterium]
MFKAVLIDFDGTLVKRDILDILCGIAGKEKESKRINKEFHNGLRTGRVSLIQRINFLKGVTLGEIKTVLDKKQYLTKGAKELLDFLNKESIVSILHSGNLVPVLQYFQRSLNISYVVGTQPQMDGDRIVGISDADFPSRNFKLQGIQKILVSLSIKPHEAFAIGDSPADKKIFEFAGASIAINAKNGIEAHADYVIKDDLRKAIPIIQKT